MTADDLRESLRTAYRARTGINPPDVRVEDPYPKGHKLYGQFWRITWCTHQQMKQEPDRTPDELAADVLEFYSTAHEAHGKQKAEKKQRAEGFE